MQRAGRIVAVCFIAVAVFVVRESLRLEYYTSIGPGPGFFPLWLGVVIGALAVTWLVQLSRPTAKAEGRRFLPERDALVRVVALLASVVATAVLIDVLGFQLTMFAFLGFLLMGLGGQRALPSAAVALAGSVGVFHVFGRYLDVTLPRAAVSLLAGLGL